MAREWALAGVSEEELKPDTPLAPPKTPKGKWQNFWYHYKLPVIITAFILLVVGICTWQILTRDDPDYRLALVTDEFVDPTAAQHLGKLLSAYGTDLDEDGKVEVQVETLYIATGNDVNYTVTSTDAQKLSAYLASGDVMFFAMDPSYYEERLRPLLSDTDDYAFFAELPAEAALVDGEQLWNWKGSALQQNAVFQEAMPEDLWFGVRTAAGSAAAKDSQKSSRECLSLLTKLINDSAKSE